MRAGKKVLIIDDDRDFTQSVTALLERNGYEVISAPDGERGVERAKADQPDLIILDIMMRDRTEGFFTMQSMRSIAGLKSVPVVILTSIYEGHPEFTIKADPSWLPCDVFLTKPVEPERLLAEVRKLTEERDAPRGDCPEGKNR